MPSSPTPPPGPAAEDRAAPAPRGTRPLAALLTGAQALALLGFAGFYLYELVVGAGSDPVRVVMSAVLIVLTGAGLAVVARGWLAWTRWPRTPTLVWDLLLLPVGWSLVQAGRGVLGGVVLAVAVATLGAAFTAPLPDDEARADSPMDSPADPPA